MQHSCQHACLLRQTKAHMCTSARKGQRTKTRKPHTFPTHTCARTHTHTHTLTGIMKQLQLWWGACSNKNSHAAACKRQLGSLTRSSTVALESSFTPSIT
uniref:Uncharacterized protein n=1 Tax=Dunaliella tertiolecta TaxID=3047 RepID=A0A7S3VI21_DUNTE|mmetsp:Transcript_2087/g.5310  ORF Transcript_2087/g.5310 Transcript_2087/m.5310 type:complete len:100 (+) Transcript_2087:671-970(+)